MRPLRFALELAVALSLAGPALAGSEIEALYVTHCAACHGGDRLGGIGPALLPENLGRLTGERLLPVIAKGREATQMPGFSEALNEAEIKALAAYISAPPVVAPIWTKDDMAASRVLTPAARPVAAPTFQADMMNLFVVVETGDHHARILNGDTFDTIARFPTRFALHGGPKFTPDGRHVVFMSRDGWVTKYDIWSLQVVAEVRAGINSRNIALSRDGRHIAVANYLPKTLVILSTEDLSVERVIDVADKDGKPSRVSAVYQARPRESFVAALKDVAEVWEIPTSDTASKALGTPMLGVRRLSAPEPLDDFFFDPAYRNLLGSAREGKAAIVLDMDEDREVSRLTLPGLPHLGSGIVWEHEGRKVMATPHLREAKVTVLDMQTWQPVKTIDTPGPGFFMRSHENTPYAWTDAMMGKAKDTMAIIDKRTLEVVRTITPMPGKTAAHVEFDRHGKYVLLSVWEKDGALIVYDAATFAEVKRIPMSKPSGKYNVWNKISFSDGTSH
jgi:mono/diheme cytochrome c family protein